MDPKIAKTKLGPYWRGVRKNHVSVQEKFIPAVFDCETVYGKVFATGFYDGRGVRICHGERKDHMRWLLEQLKDLPGKSQGTAVVSAHFAQFDLAVLFWSTLNPRMSKLSKAPQRSHFSLLDPRCEVEIFWGRPCFAKIRFGHKTVHIVDTFAFFPMGLDAALKAIGAPVRKLKKPERLGERIIPLDELAPYLEGDLLGGHELLKHVLALHTRYETRLCVSLPMLSGRLFRHFYLKRDFVRPSAKLMAGALLSYHGGKNTFVGVPGWYDGCYDLDIRSAYPEAMRQLPDFERGKWVSGKGLKFVRTHPHGIYKVWGKLNACKWGSLFSHEFKRVDGEISGLWTTGYELIEALDTGEFTAARVEGFGFKSKSKESAFRKFVDHFYKAKEQAKDPAERLFYKLILNALYGKFIQRNTDEEGNLVAGSMFDPAIASLITGYVRAKIHRLEHKYNALHTATDGLITQIQPDPKDLGEELGQLKQENYGPCLILRNKLYLHYDTAGKLIKAGFHGVQTVRGESGAETMNLTADRLLKLWKSAKRSYRVENLVRWSQAWHIQIPPGVPRVFEKTLQIKKKP